MTRLDMDSQQLSHIQNPVSGDPLSLKFKHTKKEKKKRKKMR